MYNTRLLNDNQAIAFSSWLCVRWSAMNVGHFNRVQNYGAESSLSTVFGNPVYGIRKNM
jgi:hypothetical protein